MILKKHWGFNMKLSKIDWVIVIAVIVWALMIIDWINAVILNGEPL